MKKLAVLLLLVVRAGSIVVAEDSPAVSLFDGQTLDGWIQRGGQAKYTVADGMIVGSSVPNTSNSFLCTTRTFANFELDLDFKVDPPLNSGVQVRSECFDEPRDLKISGGDGDARTIHVDAGRVHGYQVEIDPSERAWTGGLYDEGRRGWLSNLEHNQAAREAFRQNEWNHLRVVANGPSIKTWLNGVAAADLTDDLTPVGFIALQVHGVGDRAEPLSVRWKSIRLRELP